MIKRRALESALFCLEISGQNPYKLHTPYSKFINSLWIILGICFGPCMIAKIFLGSDEITNIADAASNIFVFLAAVFKIANILISRQTIINLMKQLEELWTSTIFDQEWKRNFDIESDKQMANICKLLTVLYVASGLYYVIRPIILQRKIWPVEIYMIPAIDNIYGSYYVIYLLQAITIAVLVFNMGGHDSLIFTQVYSIVLELRALQKAFKDLVAQENNEEELMMKLKSYVQYHNKILKCVEEVNRIFSSFFLYQFFCTTVGICISLFIISINMSPFHYDIVLKFTLQSLCVYLQMTMYSKGGTDLAYESESLGQAIYESDWTSAFQPKVRKMIFTIIHRSQKAAKLNAGGMLDMNFISLTAAAKSTFSYFTLLKTVYTKK